MLLLKECVRRTGMANKNSYEELLALLDTKRAGDHDWFLSLLDDERQKKYEDEHSEGVMQMLRIARIRPHKNAIKSKQAEIEHLEKEDGTAENYRRIKNLLAEIELEKEKMETYRPF